MSKIDLKNTMKNAGCIAILALALTACQTGNKETASAPLINGKWASTDNVFTATFNNGQFVAVANDTGSILSEGNYVLIDDNRVQISWFGKVSGSNNTANCVKNGNVRLDCIDKNNRSFSLVRSNVS